MFKIINPKLLSFGFSSYLYIMTKKDPFGHTIEVGTIVRFFSKHYKYTSITAKVIKITEQTLLLEHEHMNITGYTTTTRCTSAQVFVDTTGWAPKNTP